MPSPSPHAVIWSEEQQRYELRTLGQPAHCFRRGDASAWHSWLDAHTAFAFEGQAGGRLSVLREARSRGAGYWYAYRTQDRHTRKHYLGSTAKVTFDRLEAAATVLASASASSSSMSTVNAVPSLRTSLQQSLQEEASAARRADSGRTDARPSAPSQADHELELLVPKLSRPQLSAPLVERTRLLSELDAVRSHPVTLVSASAGSGKTTLLSAWMARSSAPRKSLEASRRAERNGAEPMLVWLSLDELDNDPIRYWTAVIAALRTCLPQCGRRALAMLRSPESPPLATIVMALLQDLMAAEKDIILILDDYHVISDQAIVDSMRFLLDRMVASLHLVLATRTNPDLPLARLRARAHLIEIRDRDLRFTEHEAASFLTRGLGLSLSEAEVATLHHRTEGWITGLQLAGISLRKRGDLPAVVSEFDGSHRFLLDYVQDEILAQWPETLQDFLLQSSILPRMTAALCQAVTESPTVRASQEILEMLERANLFVVPLDDKRQWYRLHDLFREALLARAQASQPDLLLVAHRRAARWYEAMGDLREAITHALEARDYSYSARLVERAVPALWLSGEAQTVLTWIAAFPDAVLSAHARLALDTVLHVVDLIATVRASHVKTLALAEQVLARLEGLVLRQDTATRTSEAEGAVPALRDAEGAIVQRHLRLLRAAVAARAMVLRDDTEGLRHLVQETEGLDAREEISWQMVRLLLNFWLTHSLQWAGALLIPELLEAKREALRAHEHWATVRVITWLVFAYVAAGRLRLAHQECLEGLALVEQAGISAPFEGYLHCTLAEVSYAWNQLDEAAQCAHQMLQIARAWQHADLLASGYPLLAQIELARGDLAAAQQALRQVDVLVQEEQFAFHAVWGVAAHVRYWLAAGERETARHWAEQVVFSLATWDPKQKTALLMQVRVLLAQQQPLQALAILERWSQQLDLPGDIQNTSEFLALQIVALHQTDQRDQAQAILERLLALTEPEGVIRLYLDAGAPMKQVLGALLAKPSDGMPRAAAIAYSKSYVSRLLAAFEKETWRPSRRREASSITTRSTSPYSPQEAGPQTPTEPLSPQELKVLRLLVAGRTYAEIAEAQVVSPNTIKTQVSSIYRKLGVSRRAEAIARTSDLHLF
jgi:LuxR family maltose regulon positive regulatory protein